MPTRCNWFPTKRVWSLNCCPSPWRPMGTVGQVVPVMPVPAGSFQARFRWRWRRFWRPAGAASSRCASIFRRTRLVRLRMQWPRRGTATLEKGPGDHPMGGGGADRCLRPAGRRGAARSCARRAPTDQRLREELGYVVADPKTGAANWPSHGRRATITSPGTQYGCGHWHCAQAAEMAELENLSQHRQHSTGLPNRQGVQPPACTPFGTTWPQGAGHVLAVWSSTSILPTSATTTPARPPCGEGDVALQRFAEMLSVHAAPRGSATRAGARAGRRGVGGVAGARARRPARPLPPPGNGDCAMQGVGHRRLDTRNGLPIERRDHQLRRGWGVRAGETAHQPVPAR